MDQKGQHESSGSRDRVDATLTRAGGLSYLEIPAVSVRDSAKFYSEVFGWQIEIGSDAETAKFRDPAGLLIGRWFTGRSASHDPGFLPYFYVDDLLAAVAKARTVGGEIVRNPYEEGNLLVATLRDPGGNLIGMWQERCFT